MEGEEERQKYDSLTIITGVSCEPVGFFVSCGPTLNMDLGGHAVYVVSEETAYSGTTSVHRERAKRVYSRPGRAIAMPPGEDLDVL